MKTRLLRGTPRRSHFPLHISQGVRLGIAVLDCISLSLHKRASVERLVIYVITATSIAFGMELQITIVPGIVVSVKSLPVTVDSERS